MCHSCFCNNLFRGNDNVEFGEELVLLGIVRKVGLEPLVSLDSRCCGNYKLTVFRMARSAQHNTSLSFPQQRESRMGITRTIMPFQ
jgi:hypothetical protein